MQTIGKHTDEKQYLDIMNNILLKGDRRESRNATTLSTFGARMEFDLSDNKIPIITTKKIACKTIIKELLWFISGDTNNKTLQNQGVHIWDKNSTREYLDENGFHDREENDLGPIYGFQWRHSGASYKTCHDNYDNCGVDQLQECITAIRETPYSRRMIVSSWNVADIQHMALPPCHALFQWYVSSNGELSLQLYQRSADFFLGVPFNVTSYSLLVHMVCHLTKLKAGKFIHIIGDAHIYENHINVVKTQINRSPHAFPTLSINREVKTIDDFKLEDFTIHDYIHHDILKADMIA
jgi:thymidylate synthase|tara:strand:+ start:1065 stop:1949 length:885 start_codon:yes stop_codon:yes gene_type:complete